jgi:hypothetical protein
VVDGRAGSKAIYCTTFANSKYQKKAVDTCDSIAAGRRGSTAPDKLDSGVWVRSRVAVVKKKKKKNLSSQFGKYP